MGMMLETSSDRLSRTGRPALRLAGQGARRCACARSRTPGACRSRSPPASSSASARPSASAPSRSSRSATLHRRYRHVQEVIVQNFRAKPGTAMRDAPEPGEEEFLATVAAARVVFGPRMNVQAPPNLSDPELPAPARRRHQRLGRRVAGHARPREPRGARGRRSRRLAAATAERGLRRSASGSRSTRSTRCSPTRGSPARCRAPVAAADGRRRSGRRRAAAASRSPWQDPEVAVEAPDHRAHVRQGGRRRPAGGRRRRVRRLRRHPDATRAWATPTRVPPERLDAEIRAGPAQAPSGTGAAHRRRGARAVPGRGRRARGALRASPTTSAAKPSATRSPTS